MIEDRFVTLAHGNGGRYMRELIAEIFARHLANPQLDIRSGRGASSVAARRGLDHHGRIYRAAARISGRRYRFACRAWHGKRSRGRGCDASLSEPQRLHRGRSGICPARSPDCKHGTGGREDAASALPPATPRSCAAARAAASILRRPVSEFGAPVCGSALIGSVTATCAGQRPRRRSRHRGAAGTRGVRAERRSGFRRCQRPAVDASAAGICRDCASCAIRPAAGSSP